MVPLIRHGLMASLDPPDVLDKTPHSVKMDPRDIIASGVMKDAVKRMPA
jgi:hypothetical protein